MNRVFVISVLVLILLAIDFYAFQGAKAAFGNLSDQGKKTLNIVYWGISISLLIGIIVYNFVSPELIGRTARSFIMVAVFMVYFAKTLVLPFVLIDDLIRLGKWVYVKATGNMLTGSFAGNSISRSEFLGRVGLAVAAVPIVGMIYGIVAGAHDYRVRRASVKLPNLPDEFDGLKIVQLSDIHSGSFFNKTAVKRGIQMVLDQKPDMIFFTGDLVNNIADEMDEYWEIFGELKAPMGVYSVLGNHDYGDYYRHWETKEAKAANLEKLKEGQKNMGWRLLMNEHVWIEKGNSKIALLGIENWGEGGFAKYGDLSKAYKGAEDAPVKLLLSHDPSHWNSQVTQEYKDIDIAFAGHTHGMQFGIEKAGIKWSPVQYRYKQWGGLYQNGSQYLYVNRGFGYLGYPGRIGMPPEITVLELKKA